MIFCFFMASIQRMFSAYCHGCKRANILKISPHCLTDIWRQNGLIPWSVQGGWWSTLHTLYTYILWVTPAMTTLLYRAISSQVKKSLVNIYISTFLALQKITALKGKSVMLYSRMHQITWFYKTTNSVRSRTIMLLCSPQTNEYDKRKKTLTMTANKA